jgi:hypothetical protein
MMSRRTVPATFCVGILLCVVLLLADQVSASRPSDRVPNLLGTWDGFFQGADDRSMLGLVRSDITQQVQRRILGNGVLLDLDSRALINTINFSATVTGADFVTGTGVASTGRLVFQAGLETYAPQPSVVFQTRLDTGLGNDLGDAAVLYPEYHFVPARGGTNRLSAILLHPFPGADTPDVAGSWRGSFQSQPTPTFLGDLTVAIDPRDRGTFPGHVEFHPRAADSFRWPFIATTSREGRIIMIAQGKAGRILYDGIALPVGADVKPTFVGGFYRLSFIDGRFDFGAINFSLTVPSTSP